MIDRPELERALQRSYGKLNCCGHLLDAFRFSLPYVYFLADCVILQIVAGSTTVPERQRLRPSQLRDVPSFRLAYRLDPDVKEPRVNDDAPVKLETIQQDFNTRRTDEALLRT